MSCTIGVVCSVGVGPGRGGRERNEDNYLICQRGRLTWREGDHERTSPGDGDGVLVAVCDGMGGHDDGDVASTVAVRVLAKLYQTGVTSDPQRAMRRFVLDSHERLRSAAIARGPVNMGTTVTLCWVLGGRAAWAQVGDSRLYLLRRGRIQQLTPDQTRGEFARRDGRPAPAVDALAQSFLYGSRGLGDDGGLRLEKGRDTGIVRLERGDRLMLCSDGLWDSVDDVSMADVLRNTPDPQAAAVACMERAITRGSTDNICVVVVRIDDVADDGIEWDDEDEVVGVRDPDVTDPFL